MKQIKSPILSINGKKAEVYCEENDLFLMSHNSKWNVAGLQPQKMHSWKCAAFLCSIDEDYDLREISLQMVWNYKEQIEKAINAELKQVEEYQVKYTRTRDDAVKGDAPLQPTPKADEDADEVKELDEIEDDAIKAIKADEALQKDIEEFKEKGAKAFVEQKWKEDAEAKKAVQQKQKAVEDELMQQMQMQMMMQGGSPAKMQVMQMMMQMMMQPDSSNNDKLMQKYEELMQKYEAICKAYDDTRLRLEALENNAPTKVVYEVKSENGINKIEGITHMKFDSVLKKINNNIPCFFFGPAGSGKNILAEQIAKALGLNFYYSNAVTQEFKVTGHSDINGNLVETEFYKAFTQGGVFMLDEADASDPNALIVLNAALANGYFDFPVVGRVQAHENFRCIAAGNTKGTGATQQYSSRFTIDEATRDRFSFINIDYDARIEASIAKAANDDEVLPFVYDVRKAAKKNQLSIIAGYRLINRLITNGKSCSVSDAVECDLYNKYNEDDMRILAGDLTTFNNKYTSAFIKIAK